MKQSRFKKIESYKHRYAKLLLRLWLLRDYLCVRIEQSVCTDGRILFVPDITCYTLDEQIIYEVVNKHEMDNSKLSAMQLYYWNMRIPVVVYEINSDWILNQVRRPDEIKATKMIDFR
jgi:hypothetical protein